MRTATWHSWDGMVQRCTNPRNPSFPDYGGRGITIDPEWRQFSAFLRDMGERPAGLQLDRRDNALGYCKDNCRWVTPLVNGNNKRNNIRLSARGETHSISEWSRRLKIPLSTLFSRHYRGWPAERVVS